MAQSYTRQSSFSDGDTITAALFNNEYNQLVNAFTYSSSSASSTGHRHDGTAGHGGNIHTIGDLDFLNKIVADSTNNRWGIFVEVSSAAVEQIRIQDGAIVPVTDNDIDLGTSSLEFKDAYFDGTVTTDALVADTADINGGTVDGATIGASSATTIVGTTITANTAFVPDASDGAALGTSSLEFSDLYLADGANIYFGDDQDVSITHVADTGLLISSTDQLQFGDSGTYIHQSADGVLDLVSDTEIEINATTIDINGAADVSGNLAVGGNLTVTGNATISGNLTFGDAASDTVAFSADVASNLLPSADNTYDIGASGSEWKDLYLDGTANIDSLVADTADINGGTIDGAIIGGSSAAAITGTAITGTSFVIGSADISEAELETIDGVTAGTVAASKAVVVDSNKDIGSFRNITLTGELDAATLDISGDADIDGTLEADAYTVDGTALNEYIADTVGAMVSSNTESGITVAYEDGDNTLDFTVGTLNQDTTGTADNITVSANNSTDETVYPIFVDGATGSQGAESDTGLTYNPSSGLLTISGELDAGSLDISGNADIDGTLEADAYTVDGTALNEYIADTVGAMVGSNTETNITVTYEDGDNTLDFVIGTLNQDTTGTADNITVSANNSTDETVYPVFVDGATGSQGAESDTGLTYNPSTGMLTTTGVTATFTGNITGNVTGNTSGTAATVTGAAQSNITSLGTLTTLTVDNVIVNGTTIGHTSDTDLITLADGNVTIAGELDLTTLDVSGNADIDGTLEADAITVDGTDLAEFISDTAGAMFSSNTETGITATYQDADNTIDLVVGTLNQDTTGTASKVTVSDSTANTNFPVVFHDEGTGNVLLDDTGALRYNPSTGELLVPKLTVAGTTTTADTVTMEASNAIIFEGATADSNETTLSIVDPTSDHTQYLVNQGGYIPVLAAATTTQISSTPAELNLLDGSSANTVVNSKAVIYGSSGELAGTLSTAAQTNITSLGTLTALTGGTGDFNWDSNTLVVDSSENRVGIGNASPDVSLDIGSFTDAMHVPVGTTAQRPGSPAAGYFRYNSTTSGFEGYTDSWGSIGGGGTAPNINTMTGDGSDTTLSLTSAPVNENATVVTIDGVVQHKDTYSISGTTLTFSEAPPDDTAVECITWVNTAITSALLLEDADSDTKVQVEESSDEDKIRFDTGGTERMVLDSTGLTLATNLVVDSGTIKLDGSYPTGTENTALGDGALDAIEATGNYNVAIGKDSFTDLTTGDYNVAVGRRAGYDLTTGSENIAIGYLSLYTETTGANNVAVGTSALQANTTASNNTAVGDRALAANTTANNNVAIGSTALTANTTGAANTAVGATALDANTTANYNVGVGYAALGANTTGADNTAVGSGAMEANTTGDDNTAVGRAALQAVTTASDNTAVGSLAGDAMTTGASNTLMGKNAGGALTTGSNHVHIGDTAGDAMTTTSNSVAIGYGALTASTVSDALTAVGHQAMTANTTGTNSTAFGHKAMYSNTTGASNTALADGALYWNTTGSSNTAVGRSALLKNTTASNNTAVGREAMQDNTTGADNVAVGYKALADNTTAGDNVAIGPSALTVNTTGERNVAVGSAVLDASSTGSYNTGIGYGALSANTTANDNTAIGKSSMIANTTGYSNTCVGTDSGAAITTGYKNTFIGFDAGDTTTTGDYNIILGSESDVSGSNTENEIVIGQNAAGKGSSTAFITPNGGNVYQGTNGTAWAQTSDRRIKKNIVDNKKGLEIINQVKIRNFEYRTVDEIVDFENPKSAVVKQEGIQLGTIAQELEEFLPEVVITEKTGVKTVDAENFTWYLINAVQELSAKVIELESKIEE